MRGGRFRRGGKYALPPPLVPSSLIRYSWPHGARSDFEFRGKFLSEALRFAAYVALAAQGEDAREAAELGRQQEAPAVQEGLR